MVTKPHPGFCLNAKALTYMRIELAFGRLKNTTRTAPPLGLDRVDDSKATLHYVTYQPFADYCIPYAVGAVRRSTAIHFLSGTGLCLLVFALQPLKNHCAFAHPFH